jgi:hypothetical protein
MILQLHLLFRIAEASSKPQIDYIPSTQPPQHSFSSKLTTNKQKTNKINFNYKKSYNLPANKCGSDLVCSSIKWWLSVFGSLPL